MQDIPNSATGQAHQPISGMSDAAFLELKSQASSLVEEPITGIDNNNEVIEVVQVENNIEDLSTHETDVESDPLSVDNEPSKDNPAEGTFNASDYTNEELSQAVDLMNSLIGKPIKAAGTSITFNSPEEIIKGLQHSADYTKKTTDIKPFRQTIAALSSTGVLESPEQLNIMIDAYNGNPEALRYLAEKHETDMDNVQDKYTPTEHTPSNETLDFNEEIEKLEGSGRLESVTNVTKTFDSSSIKELQANPKLLSNIAEDVEEGVYEEAMSIIAKDKMLGLADQTLNSINTYAKAAAQVYANRLATATEEQVAKQAAKDVQTTKAEITPLVPPANKVGGSPSAGLPPLNHTGTLDMSKVVKAAQAMAGMKDSEWKKIYGS